MPKTIHYIDEAHLEHKRILVRVDFNVPVNELGAVLSDERIKQSLPTLKLLLENQNKLILVTHLGQPTSVDKKSSLAGVAKDLQSLLPEYHVHLVTDFQQHPELFAKQTTRDILLLENIRFYPGENANDRTLATRLATLADVYVNEAFATSHRATTSMVLLPQLLPSYGGLLLKKEVTMISKILAKDTHPYVAVLGGAKVSTKIRLLSQLIEHADTILLGGGLANTFLMAVGAEIGKSLYETDALGKAREIIAFAEKKHTQILLPQDVVVGKTKDATEGTVKLLADVSKSDHILDVGPETQALFGEHLATAKMIVWNGPLGLTENPAFARGTDFLYYAISENTTATTIIGGGETIATLDGKERLEHITHISTGGGAMLAFIEKGTLPAIQALER